MEITSIVSLPRNINPIVKFSTLVGNSRRITKNNGNNTVYALRRSDSYDHGKLVDGDMSVLRKRIHEIKLLERNYEAPSEWMQWEKEIYGNSYDECICMITGLVQIQLMNTRPSVALAALLLLTLSVPTSVILILTRLAG